MEGIHYTEFGVRLLAKEIKKSLYSGANRDSKRLQTIGSFSDDAYGSHGDNFNVFSPGHPDISNYSIGDDEVFDDIFDDVDSLSQSIIDESQPTYASAFDIPCSEAFDWLL